jgi:hypothetical protein
VTFVPAAHRKTIGKKKQNIIENDLPSENEPVGDRKIIHQLKAAQKF